MIEKFEKCIKELPEELQEKARQCRTKEELDEFIAENDIELSDEALEMVSGGCGGNAEVCYPEKHYNARCRDHRQGRDWAEYFDWKWTYCSDCKKHYYFFKDFQSNETVEITKEQYDSCYDPIRDCYPPHY